MAETSRSFWRFIPLTLRAVVGGVLVGMIAANLWPVLLLNLGAPIAAAGEAVFLALYVWWFTGGSPPSAWRAQRRDFGRRRPLSAAQWGWGIVAALCFAATVHAAIVLLFRTIPFPAAAFHAGYDFSFIPTLQLQWLACVFSAISAGVCEEMGFRGYMQRPIENRHGPVIAVAVSSLLFMLLHLNKSWAGLAMTPIILGAGVLLGWLAYASGTLVFCMIGHAVMDIGLFAYWWTQIAGTFPQRPVSQTGFEPTVLIEGGVFVLVLGTLAFAITRLAKLRGSPLAASVPA